VFRIVHKQRLSEDVKRVDLYAPEIARRFEPGQFVSVVPEEQDERLPLSIVDADTDRGTITLMINEVGTTTRKLGGMAIREEVYSVVGPLGLPARVETPKTVLCVATGIGTARMLPICRAFKRGGSKVIGILGARTKKEVILEAQMRLVCDKLMIATQDGSYERRGLATDIVQPLLRENRNDPKGLVVRASGSVGMMREVCALAKEEKVPARVYLNPVMVDGLGMCGSCRVKVGGKIVMACLHGPEFNGHKVDFQDFERRLKTLGGKESCPRKESVDNRRKSGFGIFGRFLGDILRPSP